MIVHLSTIWRFILTVVLQTFIPFKFIWKVVFLIVFMMSMVKK